MKKKKEWCPGNEHRFVDLGDIPNPKDDLEATFGPLAADAIRDIQTRNERLKRRQDDPVEESLRMVDYLLADEGSTEDLVGERRALSIDGRSDADREEFRRKMEEMVEKGRLQFMGLDKLEEEEAGALSFGEEYEEDPYADKDDPETFLDPNQKAHGEWSELLVDVDRTSKLWRGGRLESYRALVVGGNLNGCGGFGIGKSWDPIDAVADASRKSKRNIFFVDRYQGDGLTRDLAGKQNSCRVVIRATNRGLFGNDLVTEILKRFGITNASAKAYGKRHPYNVVRATFKALMTHESLEEIAMKRGKRIVSVDRAMRMQV
jgi:small subunit ribosomal protein S5